MTCHIQSSSCQTSTLHNIQNTVSCRSFFPWVTCSSSLVGSVGGSIRLDETSSNESIDRLCFKATQFFSLPRRCSAQCASDRQNGAVRSGSVRDVGPRVDALRRRDVQTRWKDVVGQLHRLADTLFVRRRRLGEKRGEIRPKFSDVSILFQTTEITVA